MNQSPATWIVPPLYIARLIGYDAVVITARKVYLVKDSVRVMSRFYSLKSTQKLKSFGDWVSYVKEANT